MRIEYTTSYMFSLWLVAGGPVSHNVTVLLLLCRSDGDYGSLRKTPDVKINSFSVIGCIVGKSVTQ